MELYRVLRLAIYMVATSGGLAIAQVEGNLTCLIAVIAAAVIAWVTVDSGRMRPVRPLFTGAFGIVLLLHYLVTTTMAPVPGVGESVPRMMHFLSALQIMLFFTAFRGSLVFTFCGANLFIVIVSGVISPDVTLLFRMILFLASTSWLLFVHSMWLERQKFETRQSMPGPAQLKRVSSPDRLGDRALWQGLRMTTYVTLTCLVTGFLLFFVWPRATFAAFENLFPPRYPENGEGRGGGPGDPGTPPSGPTTIGPNERVRLDRLAPIHRDTSPALSVRLDQSFSNVVGPNGEVYFRDRAMANYLKGEWRTPRTFEVTAKIGETFIDFPKNAAHFRLPRDLTHTVEQRVRALQPNTIRACFALAPVRRILLNRIEVDEEGALLLPNDEFLDTHTELVLNSNRPVSATELPEDAIFDPSQVNRYAGYWHHSFTNQDAHDITALARKITAGATSDLERLHRLLTHMKSPDHHTYTLDLSQRKLTSRDVVAEFLLSQDAAQRQGHCAYFATGFVMLCRSIGIPARLATGFARRLSPEQQSRNAILFLNDEAHAWAEIYFKDYGWVAFDPSPGSTSPEPGPLTPPDPNPSPGPYFDPDEMTTIEPSWLGRQWSYFMAYNQEQQENMYKILREEFGTAIDSAGVMFSLGSDWGGLGVILMWTLVVGGAAALLFLFWNRNERRRATARNIPRQARVAVSFYQELLHVLSRHGFMRRPGQTPREFASSVVRRGGDAFLPALVVTQVFEQVRYGGKIPTPTEIDDLRLAMETLSVHGSSSTEETTA